MPINILDIFYIQFLKITKELGHMPYCIQDMCVDVSNDEGINKLEHFDNLVLKGVKYSFKRQNCTPEIIHIHCNLTRMYTNYIKYPSDMCGTMLL
jgi:hypothetical protein